MSKKHILKYSLLICLCIATLGITAQAQNIDLVAYAHVLGDGTLDTANSKNITNFSNEGNGFYCFTLNFRPKNVIAALADDPTAPDQGVGFIKVENAPVFSASCSIPNPDSQVETGDQTSINGGISASGYAFYVTWHR
jgi:hypothetical protein